MSSYVDTPIPTDDLDISQPQMRTNFSSANTTFGIDHYPFNDLTSNLGYHKITHWPNETPPTSNAAYAQMYGYQPTANVGIIQFSTRGAASQVPSPITNLQSPVAGLNLAPTTTSTILDFTGLPNCLCTAYYFNITNLVNAKFVGSTTFWWDAADTIFYNLIPANTLTITNAGNILQIKNNHPTVTFANAYWTLEFLRIG